MSSQDGTSKTQVSDDITPLTFCLEEEVGALEEGVLHPRHPDKYPHVACRKKRVSKREATVSDQNENSTTSKIAVESILLYNRPG